MHGHRGLLLLADRELTMRDEHMQREVYIMAQVNVNFDYSAHGKNKAIAVRVEDALRNRIHEWLENLEVLELLDLDVKVTVTDENKGD